MALLTMLVWTLAITGWAQAAAGARTDATVADQAGAALFQKNCAFCHGPDAAGGEGPDLLRSSLVNHDVDGDLILPIVHGARQSKGMPAFQLTTAQVQDIAAFLHARIQALGSIYYRKDAARGYKLSRLLVGDAQRGESDFFGKAKCSQCHSPKGDLAHVASKYSPIDLQNRFVYPAGAVPTLTVTLPSGERMTGKEVYVDPFFVSLRDSQGWVRTWPRKQVTATVDDPLAGHLELLKSYSDETIHDLFAFLETLK